VRVTLRTLGIIAAAFAMASCSMFSDDDEKELEPAELLDIVTKVDIRKLWSANIGDDAEFLRLALQPAGDGNRIYAASRDGNVVALQPESGKEIWRTKLEVDLSAGPGVGGDLVVVGSADGELIGLDSNTGIEIWRVDIAGETLARPIVKDSAVVAITIDNRLVAVSAFDGSARWSIEQSTPRLTMRGSATPVLVGSSVIAGFDNGRLVAVDIDSGDVEWETMLSPPTGRSDLERLADVDGQISVVGQDLYAAGYNGAVAAVASESGQILWSREVSSYEGVSADWNNVYTVNDEGVVLAMTRRDGEETWRQNALTRREPTLPVAFYTTVVAGDLEGYLHFFSNFDGEPVARLRVGKAAISTDPVVFADRLYVQSDSGSVSAFVVRQAKPASNAPDTSDEGA